MRPERMKERAAELAAQILDEPVWNRAEWKDTKFLLLAIARAKIVAEDHERNGSDKALLIEFEDEGGEDGRG